MLRESSSTVINFICERQHSEFQEFWLSCTSLASSFWVHVNWKMWALCANLLQILGIFLYPPPQSFCDVQWSRAKPPPRTNVPPRLRSFWFIYGTQVQNAAGTSRIFASNAVANPLPRLLVSKVQLARPMFQSNNNSCLPVQMMFLTDKIYKTCKTCYYRLILWTFLGRICGIRRRGFGQRIRDSLDSINGMSLPKLCSNTEVRTKG